MRKLLAVAVLVAPLSLLTPSSPVHAQPSLPCTPVAQGNGAATCTVQMPMPQSFPVGAPCVSDGMLFWDATGVFHITVNKAGDAWMTSTIQGPFTIVSFSDPTNVLASGHGQGWFGGSFNQQNSVMHSTTNFVGRTSAGTQVAFHEDFHVNFTASGFGPIGFDKIHC